MNFVEQPRLALFRSTKDCPLSFPEITIKRKFESGYQDHQQLEAVVFYLISWLKHTQLTTEFQQRQLSFTVISKTENSHSWLNTLNLELLSSMILMELARLKAQKTTQLTEP